MKFNVYVRGEVIITHVIEVEAPDADAAIVAARAEFDDDANRAWYVDSQQGEITMPAYQLEYFDFEEAVPQL